VRSFITWLHGIALTLGGPGLLAVAFLDSSFISLPQINDILVVLMVIEHKQRMPYYALMATAGSVAGCLAIYYIAEKGGETFLRKRLRAGHIERALALYRRLRRAGVDGAGVVAASAPFKLFVLAAGLAEVRVWQFVWAIAVARGARYLALGLLAVYYGDRALELMRTHGQVIAMWLAGLIVLGAVLWWVRGKRLRARGRLTPRERGAFSRHPALQRGTERRASPRGAVGDPLVDGSTIRDRRHRRWQYGRHVRGPAADPEERSAGTRCAVREERRADRSVCSGVRVGSRPVHRDLRR
jgi:membrane protein YqaA with SNARE-associated domain